MIPVTYIYSPAHNRVKNTLFVINFTSGDVKTAWKDQKSYDSKESVNVCTALLSLIATSGELRDVHLFSGEMYNRIIKSTQR